ncbi:hypothetical protein HK099_005109 [Clydaea vesicula]|uniref:Nucleotide-sugar transporter n=1 Tax=Clydaea vesicula TaxID=447962 RepID=A0AAD5XZS8_9FUNG|nr:hypothetical protein HK099_005109 [Clydaea vesicula]KAJ3390433.1 hypothetical protein HDU92_000507 [Lobulomyces angularis]
MLVPAVLYLVQNNLQYVAVGLLDAATFQVTYQLKILTTAIFSVLMLNKRLTASKWISLLILTIGIALVQLPSQNGDQDKNAESDFVKKLVGLFSVLIACVLSGIAGVWFEKVLKGTESSIWVRNIQLSFLSFIPGIIFGVYVMDGESVRVNGFFYGYTAWTWAAICCQAFGGLIVAIVVKYADNILKGFATSLSIIISCVASVYLFESEITNTFILGSIFVLYATHLYGLPEKVPPVLPSNSEDNEELLKSRNR